MRIEIKGLAELRERLARLRPEEIMASALREQADRLAEAVRGRLAQPPGAGGHAIPWRQTGDLQASIGAQSNGLQAVVGSNDPAAAPQERGTARIPPRPFLAPTAAELGEDIAHAVGAKLAGALRGESAGGADDTVQLASSAGTDAVAGLLGLGVVGALGYFAHKSLSDRPRTPNPTVLENSSHPDGENRPPPGSKPINETPWSGDHAGIKEGIGNKAPDSTKIAPNGDVWSEQPDGSWVNHGPASSFTGSGKPSGKRGKDRGKR